MRIAFDRRKEPRRLVDLAATLFTSVDAPVWDCVVMDISTHGARLAVESGTAIPDQFTLLLSANGRASRCCLVMWRAGHQLGVKFVAPAPVAGELVPDDAIAPPK
jgi:PilZ domain